MAEASIAATDQYTEGTEDKPYVSLPGDGTLVLDFGKSFTDAIDYRVTIPAGFFTSEGEDVGGATLNYLFAPPTFSNAIASANPAPGIVNANICKDGVNNLTFVLNADVTVNKACTDKIRLNIGTRVSPVAEIAANPASANAPHVDILDAGSPGQTHLAMIFGEEPITEPGVYTLTVPAGFFLINGTECEPITVEPQMWENTRYTVDEATNTIMPEVQGTFSQLPLRLAWAITIHKSQGLTFPRVIIDAGAAFAPGQVYVALSRCTSLEGIVLATPIGAGIIGGDPAVNSYIAGQQEAAARSAASLPAIKQDYYRSLMLDMFNFGTLVSLQESLHRVMSQTFSHAFPKETARQAEIAITLREKVVDVADKWIAVISSQSFEALTSQAMLDRVCRSALYFQKELTGIFGDSLTAAARVRTDNKKASQRVKDLVADIRASLGR
ncbi:MAG: ATP-binding domain-containing protein, partial [Muribaculaceae bacterium]|nr:ATP-binding domain-containing protein [Muribaculaceae bacterium]